MSTNFSDYNSKTLFCLDNLVDLPPIHDFVSSDPWPFLKIMILNSTNLSNADLLHLIIFFNEKFYSLH